MPSSRAAALVLLAFTTGCSALTPECTDDLSWRTTPSSATLAVGQQFTASAQFLGCRGTRNLSDAITWSSQDTTIARVDAATGTVTAISPGTTGVIGTGARYGSGPRISVNVTP